MAETNYSLVFLVGVLMGGAIVGSLAWHFVSGAMERAQIGGVQRCIVALEELRESIREEMGNDPLF